MSDARDDLGCFTIMPFGAHGEYQDDLEKSVKESDYVYSNIIIPGLELAARQLKRTILPTREVDRCLPGSITKRIIRSLGSADIVIADITGQNPNVFLELGIRYALCPNVTLLLRQGEQEIPFDIANLKVIAYDIYQPEPSSSSIAEYIVNSVQDPTADSPVFDTIDDLAVSGAGISRIGFPVAASNQVMSWDEIMRRISALGFYDEHYRSGSFRPDAVVGITNGGLIIAEVLSRKYFHHVPLVSLWADRWSPELSKDPKKHYFTNVYAKAAIKPLRDLLKNSEKENLTLLVVDDNVSSGLTCKYAVEYLREKLGEKTRLVFQPLVCKAADKLSAVEDLLPPVFDGNLFDLNRGEFVSHLLTDKSRFPYEKDIRG